MARILLVTQEKGGVGKSLISRALAEAVPEAPVIEVAGKLGEIELRHDLPLARAGLREDQPDPSNAMEHNKGLLRAARGNCRGNRKATDCRLSHPTH